jgi:hypothetical protein
MNFMNKCTCFLAVLGALIPRSVDGQAFACDFVEDCKQASNMPCQEWINSMSSWRGSCCSFQDVADDESGIQCELTIVGSCGWFDPRYECAANATECIYGGEMVSVIEEAECPVSIYNGIDDSLPVALPSTDNSTTPEEMMEPTMSPVKNTAPEETMEEPEIWETMESSTTPEETMEPTKSPTKSTTPSASWSCATSYAKILAGVIVLVFLV